MYPSNTIVQGSAWSAARMSNPTVLPSANGCARGTLESVSVDPNGNLVGSFSNGLTHNMARVALATFENPAGLARMGNVHFVATANSGTADVGAAMTRARGTIVGGALEQSNVDVAQELTQMIIAQRGFEVNSRLISTTDRILETLISLGG